MKRHKYFMVMAAIVALMLPCKANEAVQAAAKTAAENMTGKNIAKLYKVRTEAENPDQREVIIQACIAGLYAIGDTKNAKKINQGENRDGFIDSLMKECDHCHGEGRSQEGCYKCKGSGDCQNRKCNNGTVIGAGFDGRSNVRKCSNCEGSGKCTNCEGTGKVARNCSRCNGSKRVIDKTTALASCRDMLNALIACGNEIQRRKKAEESTQLAQKMVEKEKQAREKAESSARLAEQNAENEKLAREKAEGDARFAEQNAKHEKFEREKAEETARHAQKNAEREKQIREKAESEARLAEQGAQNEKLQREQAEESEKKVSGGTIAIPNRVKGGGRTNVVMPTNARSLKGAFPSSYKTIESVVIQDGVTSIEDSAFSGCCGLTSVTIPKGVTSIGSLAFKGCTGLTSVVIPDSVTDIGHSAFEGCVGLTSVVIPDSVKNIYHSAFKGCIGLTSVTIPDNVERIDSCTFGDCSGLKKVVIGKNVTSSYHAFDGCSEVTSVTMPACLRLSSLFPDAYETIQSVVIQDGATSIVHGAFEGCTGLTSVTMPNSVTSIEYDAFSKCSGLTNVTIPRSVKSIGNGAFSGCAGLTSVTIPDNVTSIGHRSFGGCTGLTSVVIPNSVTSIDSYAFSGCSALTSVKLPQSLEKLGSRAFERCEKLVSFGNKEFKGGDISTEAFAGTQYTVMDIDGVKCIKETKDAARIKQNDEFEKNLAKITSERKCDGDCCEISANGLQVGVIKRKSDGFNYVVSGRCNGVSNTRLYYKWNGWTETEDVDWKYDFNYMILSDENEWANWMNALKVVHTKVIEWVDLAAKNDIDKVEKEIPIGGIEVLAHSNLITKGKGQRELYLSATRECVLSDTPVKFFCKMSRNDYKKDKGEYSGGVLARCGYFEQEILSFRGDKTRINDDISLLIERFNPASLKKTYLEHARKQDLFK